MNKLLISILLLTLFISSLSMAIQILNIVNIGYKTDFQIDVPPLVRENGYRVSWSHTFNLILFDEKKKDGYYDIYVMKPDGSNVRCLTDTSLLPKGHKGCAEWHPSGRYIVFTCQKENYFGSRISFLRKWFDKLAVPGIGFNCDLWVMDNNGTKFWRLTDIPTKQRLLDKQDYTAIIHPHFSHDGSKLVWSERIGSADNKWGEWCLKIADFIVDEDGPHIENIKSHQPGFNQPCFYESHGFSVDDKRIIFSGNLEPGQDENHLDIYTFDLETMVLTRLTDTMDEWDEHAHYSPDGEFIIWMSSNGYGMNTREDWWNYLRTEYWIMRSDGSDKRQLTFYNPNNSYRVICSDCSWNADGTKIAGTILVVGENYSKGGIIILDISDIRNATMQMWDNSLGPYGGDRKNIVIDPHNSDILFVDSCDNSGVWVSKTAGESTGDPNNPAWRHTQLDRGYTEIAGTYDEEYTYIFAVMGGKNSVYRLKYSKDEDPANKKWEESVFKEGKFLGIDIVSDPYRPNRIVIYAIDSDTHIFRVFQSIEYGRDGSWKEISFTDPPVDYNIDIGIDSSTIGFDEENEDLLYLALVYSDSNNQMTSALFSYNLEDEQWNKLSDEIHGLITSFSITDNKIYMTIGHSMDYILVVGEKNNSRYNWEYRDIVLEDGTVLSSCNARGIIVAPYDSSTLFLGITKSLDENINNLDVRGLYKSVDGGLTWKRVAKPDKSYMCYPKSNSIFFDPNDSKIMYIGMTNFDCIRKSIDYGETWYPITEGLNGINVFGVAVKDDMVYGVVQSAIAINNDSLTSNNWVYRQIASSNGKVTANLYGGVEIDPFNSSIILVGAGHRHDTLSHNGGIFRNANHGYSESPIEWRRVLYDSDPSDNLNNPQIMDIYFSKTTPGLVFAAAMINVATMSGERGIYVSFDHGLTWDWIYKTSDMYYIAGDPIDSNIYYVVGSSNNGGKIVKIIVEDNKVGVEESKTVLLGDYFYSIDIQQGLPLEETYAFIGTENGRVIRIPLSDLRNLDIKDIMIQYEFNFVDKIMYEFEYGHSTVVAVNPFKPNEIYVGLYNGGIYRSIDSGLTWYYYGQGLTSSAIDIFELKFSSNGDRVFAGTLGGIAVLDLERR